MELLGDRLISASITRTWDALNDAETLRRSMPGCESLERTGDNSFAAQLTLRIGPVNARFKGNVTLSDVVPPQGYTLAFDGTGGVAGFGKGTAKVQLTAEGADATRLRYQSDAKVGGKIAQVGSRLVEATAARMAEEFFKRFEDIVREQNQPTDEAPNTSAGTPEASSTAAPSAPRIKAWMWAAPVAIVVIAILYFTSR